MSIRKAERKRLPAAAYDAPSYSVLQYLVMVFQSILRLFFDWFFNYA